MPNCRDCDQYIQSGARCQVCRLEHVHGNQIGEQTSDVEDVCPACDSRIHAGEETRDINGRTGHVECRGQARCDGGEIEVCPECDSPALKTQQPHKPAGGTDGSKYRCIPCGAAFDEPVTRERQAAGHPTRGLAKRLADTDPDDVRADGGAAVCTACDEAITRGPDEPPVRFEGERIHPDCLEDVTGGAA